MHKHAILPIMDDTREFLEKLAEEQKLQELALAGDVIGELAVDLYKSGKDLVLEAAIGGIRNEDVNIEISKDSITITGRRHRDHATHRKHYIVNECHWGSFSRQIDLPEEVNADASKATIKNGVLRVVMPMDRL